MKRPRVLVLASGTKDGGGSGFQELVEFSRTDPPVLDAEIVGVVSNIQGGGVEKRAKALKIQFTHWFGCFGADGYRHLVESFQADYVVCSGWLKYVRGLDPSKVVNIHPGPLPEFGGLGMHGHYVHDAVIKAYSEGRITQSAVTMHFAIEKGPEGSKDGYDRGPIFFQLPVLIRPDDTAETLAARVNEKERAWQAYILNLVVHGLIHLEKDDESWKVVYENGLENIIPH